MTPRDEPDSVYEGVPAYRVDTLTDLAGLLTELDRDEVSYRVKIVPPRLRTHRRPKGHPRQFVVMVLGEADV